jgi:predicted phage tail protein
MGCESPANPERDATPPAVVTSLSAAPGNKQVTLSWTDPADADLDRIEITWTGGSGGTATAEKSTAENQANSTIITGLTNGTEYTFTVKAVDATGNKSAGETATEPPKS